eukprot:14956341-Heterocapsa_arctica.AAC.1
MLCEVFLALRAVFVQGRELSKSRARANEVEFLFVTTNCTGCFHYRSCCHLLVSSSSRSSSSSSSSSSSGTPGGRNPILLLLCCVMQ